MRGTAAQTGSLPCKAYSLEGGTEHFQGKEIVFEGKRKACSDKKTEFVFLWNIKRKESAARMEAID